MAFVVVADLPALGREAAAGARVQEEVRAELAEQAEDLKASLSEKAQALAGLEELQRELAALGAHQAANQARMEAELQEARAVAARLEGLATEREAAHAEELEASQAEAAENMGEIAGSLALPQVTRFRVEPSRLSERSCFRPAWLAARAVKS